MSFATHRSMVLLLLCLAFTLRTTGLGMIPDEHSRPQNVPTATSGDPPLRVLFIGNSLTYTNDLPGTLTAIGTLGNHALSCASVTGPGFALTDHLDGGSDAVDVIRQGNWTYVILQQGPSSLPESRVILVDATIRFNVEIWAVGASTALYMVWPDKSRLAFFDAVRDNYKAAADTVGGIFLPAGEAWLTAWASDPSLAFYGADDFHPTPLATFLVALVIYERLTGADARDLPPIAVVAGDTLAISSETVRLLQAAAHTTNGRYTIAGVKDPPIGGDLPSIFALRQNSPNPWNPSTTIRYELPHAGRVRLALFNLLGEQVRTIVDADETAGYYTVGVNADALPSGVYFYSLSAGAFREVKKMLLMK